MAFPRIGLDFDGVTTNTPRLKIEIAAQKFGIYLSSKDINKKDCIKKGFTEQKYQQLQEMLYSSYRLRPMMGAIKYMQKLDKEKQYMRIVSYRKQFGKKIIYNFLSNYGLGHLDHICTDSKPKRDFCKDLDVFFDDRLEHLLNISNDVKHLFLFSKPYNEDENSPLVKRVSSWKEFYEAVQALSAAAPILL